MSGPIAVAPQTRVFRMPRRRKHKGIGWWLVVSVLIIAAVITITAPFLPLPDPDAQNLRDSLAPISAQHWLGTDEQGRDFFSRTIWAIHRSSLAAVTALAVAVVIGLPLGLIAGYRRGWIDQFLSRAGDVILTVPALILLLAAQAALNTGIQGQMIVLGVIFAPRLLRVIRGETIRVAGAPYVQAGKMAGVPQWKIFTHYLLPGVRSQFVVQVSYLLGLALVVEAGISFLGLGVRPPEASLGSLLIGASGLLVTEPRLVFIPATILTLLILCLNIFGDYLIRGKKS